MSRHALHNPGAPIRLSLAGMAFTAFSISGLATYVLAPDFDACFDLGHCDLDAARLRRVFLSHTHQDHAGGVHRHLSLREMLGAPAPEVFCPAESADELRAMLHAWSALERHPPRDLDAVVRPVRPGDRVALGRRVAVEVFDVAHRVPSRGFTVIETQRSLRAPWAGRSAREVSAAVRAGEPVHVETQRRRLTYVGDSTVETFVRSPELSDCDVLFIEATHLPGTEVERATLWGHTHLDELVALHQRSPELLRAKHIVIKHFSVRYGPEEIAAAHRGLPDGLRERVLMLA